MKLISIPILVAISLSCQSSGERQKASVIPVTQTQALDTATFAGGCFWCVEAAFEQIKGVHEVVSGYAGGKASTADYNAVASGKTEHAEAVQVYYDPNVINYSTLIEILFTAHDPTQLNRQGPDVGPQYRSAIFYHDDDEKRTAEEMIKKLQPDFKDKIVTQLNPFTKFYLAEEYHQDFEKKNPFHPYIRSVSKPKIEKVKIKFMDLLKEEFK